MNWFRRRKSIVENDIDMKNWVVHFSKLLNEEDETQEGTDEMSDNEPDEMEEKRENREDCGAAEEDNLNRPLEDEEIIRTLRKLKSGKAAGEDGITKEFLINLPSEAKLELFAIIKQIWDEGKIPETWRTAMIFPIFKSGDENDVGYKVLATIMAERLGSWLEKNGKLSKAQGGFRSKRSAMEHVFVLNSVIANKLKQKRNHCTWHL